MKNNKQSSQLTKAEQKYTVGIVGVRGYVGQELLTLIMRHPLLKLEWVSSRQLKGQSISNLGIGLKDNDKDVIIESLSADDVAAKKSEIIILALPNGLAMPYFEALQNTDETLVIIDLSADFRFDHSWHYSIPEIDNLRQGKLALDTPVKISNPGCYATAMQLAITPIKDLVVGRPNCFGVSGYSGAGTKPSPNNDVERLSNNIVGYALVEHLHEKEVSARLNKSVSFSPHVAEFFRGINMTVQIEFTKRITAKELFNRFNDFYAMHPMVVCKTEIPTLKEVVNSPYCIIGGFSVSKDGKRATIVSCLDNLLKGAASQALQNINLALGLSSTFGLISDEELNPLTASINCSDSNSFKDKIFKNYAIEKITNS